MDIRKVAVIGAGVMGAGIAAHVTNAGIPVVLLDIVPPNASDRSVVAKTAIEKMLKTEPAPFMHPKNAKLITPGNIEDDLGLLADCDWIIEAVVERLDIKQSLYHQLESVRRTDAIVSSNTSSIRLSTLMAGMPDCFQQHFLITHFFNPPRYMRLLEIAVGEQTLPAVVERIHQFCDFKLGKGVVFTHDTPGFIANRIGIYWIQTAILEAIRLGLSVEEADAVVGRPMGIPKTGVFGLSDLVGIDIMPHLMQTMRQGLAPNDPLLDKMVLPDVISKMLQNGYNGRKGKGGFYRINREKGGKVKESINLNTGTYAPSQAAQLASVEAARKGGLPVLIAAPDKGGDYAWSVLSQTLSYAASLLPEVSDNIPAIDQAMRLGYNWKYGPFELIDQIGADNFAKRLSADGRPVPSLVEKARAQGFYRIKNGEVQYLTLDGSYANFQRPAGVLLLADIKRHSQPIAKNPSASLWDIGDGVVCLEFTSKMNAMDPQIIEMLQDLYRAAGTQGEGPKLFPLRGRDFGLTGWKEFWPESERSLMFGKPDTAFGVVCDLTLQPNRSTRLIFLRTEAHQTYCNLLNTTLRPNMVVLQDHGFGGNWQDFGNEESPMYLAALEQRALPPRLFVAESNTRPWPGYHRSGSEVLLEGQMHQYQRVVYERIA